jgi:DNA-binding response OmpR family regulator
MSRNTDRLLNLTNQLLDFRKTESEAYLLNPETQNVSQLIRDTYLLFTSLATQRNIHFQLDLPRNEIFVRLDKEAFLKIVSNLVNNAMKYCDSYVKLSAFTTENDGKPEFHLVVENDGDLIPSHFKDEIFKPFIHIDKQTDKTTTGTGIGLALSRSLAELHNGTLVLEESDEVNRFHLTLPMAETKIDSHEQSETNDTKPNGDMPMKEKNRESDYTVLLVEDDGEMLGFITKCLLPNYNILTAENGLQALEVLSENNVHLIVSDVMMPEMDGFDFTRRVKSEVNFSHIPVILLTAKTNVQSKVQGFETGADAYIEKPFSIEVLMAQVANLLQSREKLRETFLKHPFIGVSTVAITKSDEEFIQKLHGIVKANLGNCDFNVEDISDEFNMSRASFYRKIKGILDLTPNEYIRVERLKKAAQLLKENNFKVNEICYMVGFNSPSYFSKCFQQQFGVLPKDFI